MGRSGGGQRSGGSSRGSSGGGRLSGGFSGGGRLSDCSLTKDTSFWCSATMGAVRTAAVMR